MNDYTELILREKVFHQKHKPPWWKQAEFRQWSVINWTLQQLYEITLSNETCPIILRIEEFKDLMDEYACRNQIFSPAYDEAVYVFDLCMAD